MASDSALLIIDVQNAMFADESPVHDGQQLLQTLGDLIMRARAADVPVIYVRHGEAPGEPLADGTHGWQIHPAIAPMAGEPIVDKRTPDSFHETTLQQELAARGVTKLIIAGIQTEMCVDTTCRRAASLGYDVTLVTDAHSTWDSSVLTAEQIIAHHNATLRWFATPVTAAALVF
jgi:nicotinamidase-related amidase